MNMQALKPLIEKAIFDAHAASVIADNMKVEKPTPATTRELFRRTTLANASALALDRAMNEPAQST